jgi:hypothetical protein
MTISWLSVVDVASAGLAVVVVAFVAPVGVVA